MYISNVLHLFELSDRFRAEQHAAASDCSEEKCTSHITASYMNFRFHSGAR